MTLLTPWALAGLIVLVPLVVLHTRRQRDREAEVPSLIPWQNILSEAAPRRMRAMRFALPLLALLQLLAAAILIFSLARPVNRAGARSAAAERIFVLDDSVRMNATDVAPDRLEAAKRSIARRIDGAPPGTLIRIIAAVSQPRLVVSTEDRRRALAALAAIPGSDGAPDLSVALTLATSLAGGRDQRIGLVRARGDPAPHVAGVSDQVVGSSDDNQALVDVSAQCRPAARRCDVFAEIRNQAARRVKQVLQVRAKDGRVLATRRVALGARAGVGVSFTVPSTASAVLLRLLSPDLLAADSVAWAALPSPPRTQVAVVGTKDEAGPLMRALRTVPGVVVQRSAPGPSAVALARRSDLAVLDGWLPSGGLRGSPAVVMMNPPRLPGGRVGGRLGETEVSGEDRSSDLLAGVQLNSLVLPAGAAQALTLPPTLAPVLWSTRGTLLASGTLHGTRTAVLAFDPQRTDLTDLDAFPVLIDNLVRWSQAWIPQTVAVGTATAVDAPAGTTRLQITPVAGTGGTAVDVPLSRTAANAVTLSRPGLYVASERGGFGERSAVLAADAPSGTPTAAATSVPPTAAVAVSAPSTAASWWPWLGYAALVCLVLELVYIARPSLEVRA